MFIYQVAGYLSSLYLVSHQDGLAGCCCVAVCVAKTSAQSQLGASSWPWPWCIKQLSSTYKFQQYLYQIKLKAVNTNLKDYSTGKFLMIPVSRKSRSRNNPARRCCHRDAAFFVGGNCNTHETISVFFTKMYIIVLSKEMWIQNTL